MTEEQERKVLEAIRRKKKYIRIATLNNNADRVRELVKSLMNEVEVEDIKLIQSYENSDEFFVNLTALREEVGLSRYEAAELLKRSELRNWIDEIHEMLKESDEED